MIFPNFQNSARCVKNLKDNKDNSLHLGRKYVRIFVFGHYLFLVAHSFPRATLSENCSLLGTDNVRGQISSHIFAQNGGYCLFIPTFWNISKHSWKLKQEIVIALCFSCKYLIHQGGGGVLGSIFAGYVPLATQNPYPIIVYSVANYRPHLSHFWANVIFPIPVTFCWCLYLIENELTRVLNWM